MIVVVAEELLDETDELELLGFEELLDGVVLELDTALLISDNTSAQSPCLGKPFERSSIFKFPPSSK